MIRHPLPRELTQGTIFTCAVAEDYKSVPVLGIIITARCDVAHGKASLYNYIPLVPFEDWLLQDGRRILASKSAAAANSSMNSALTTAGLSPSILHTLPLSAISAELSKSIDKTARLTAKKFDDAVLALNDAKLMAEDGVTMDKAKAFIGRQKKIYNSLVLDLLSNSISEYHYLERSTIREDCHGYVSLLREIRFIPASAAEFLLSGIDSTQFTELCVREPKLRDKLSINTREHYAMPVGLMESPYIEHIMQRLTHLFSRIGVTDYKPTKLASVRALVPFEARTL